MSQWLRIEHDSLGGSTPVHLRLDGWDLDGGDRAGDVLQVTEESIVWLGVLLLGLWTCGRAC